MRTSENQGKFSIIIMEAASPFPGQLVRQVTRELPGRRSTLLPVCVCECVCGTAHLNLSLQIAFNETWPTGFIECAAIGSASTIASEPRFARLS